MSSGGGWRLHSRFRLSWFPGLSMPRSVVDSAWAWTRGKVYGLDVRETPSIVFVVDFAIYESPGYIEEVGDVATGDASEETQEDVAQKTGESVALALVPGGMLIRAGLNKHRDLAGRSREQHPERDQGAGRRSAVRDRIPRQPPQPDLARRAHPCRRGEPRGRGESDRRSLRRQRPAVGRYDGHFRPRRGR